MKSSGKDLIFPGCPVISCRSGHSGESQGKICTVNVRVMRFGSVQAS